MLFEGGTIPFYFSLALALSGGALAWALWAFIELSLYLILSSTRFLNYTARIELANERETTVTGAGNF